MRPTEFIVENSIIAQEADDMHRDHEVQMARSQMYSSAQAAIEIHRLLRDVSEMEGLEGWVQSKLTLASQYLESVRDYLKYEAVSQEPEMMAFAEGAANYAIEQMLSEMSGSRLERSKKLRERIHYLERKIKEQAAGAAPQTSFGPGGMSASTAPNGDITTRSDIGGTSVTQTKTPGGFTKQTTADMDLGPQGSVGMVQAAPTQPGQLAGTTTVTRTAAPTVPGQGSATAATGTAVQGVGFGGAGKGIQPGQNIVTTGDADLAQQAKTMMPVSEEDDEIRVRKPGGDYVDPDLKYAQSQRRDRILSTPKGEINPDLQRYAERNVPRKLGDEGLRGIKSTGGGFGPSRIERPEGIPKVSKTPVTRFGMPGPGGEADPRLGADLDPKIMMKRSMKESATGGSSSAGAVATSMAGPGHKPTSGVPKKLGNAHKTKRVAVGKGIYNK